MGRIPADRYAALLERQRKRTYWISRYKEQFQNKDALAIKEALQTKAGLKILTGYPKGVNDFMDLCDNHPELIHDNNGVFTYISDKQMENYCGALRAYKILGFNVWFSKEFIMQDTKLPGKENYNNIAQQAALKFLQVHDITKKLLPKHWQFEEDTIDEIKSCRQWSEADGYFIMYFELKVADFDDSLSVRLPEELSEDAYFAKLAELEARGLDEKKYQAEVAKLQKLMEYTPVQSYAVGNTY